MWNHSIKVEIPFPDLVFAFCLQPLDLFYKRISVDLFGRILESEITFVHSYSRNRFDK